MPEKYDPLKSAELTTEQNYNMIDGILNNGPAPVLPPEEKPLDKVRRSRPNAAAGSARSVDEKAPSLRPSQCHGNARGAGADL